MTLYLFSSLQIKATDNGRPQKSSTARLHIEWIRQPPPSTVPLLFDEPFYNFTVMENDKVAEIVGVVSMQQSSASLWFDITGKKNSLLVNQTVCCKVGCAHAQCMMCIRLTVCWCVLVYMICSLGAVALLHGLLCSAHCSHLGNSSSRC